MATTSQSDAAAKERSEIAAEKITHSHPLYNYDAGSVWKDLEERFNEVKNIRIFQLHRGIAMNSLGTYSVVVYFTKLRELWAEYDALVPSPSCDYARSMDYIEHLQRQRLLQFLSGEVKSQRSFPFPPIGKGEHIVMPVNRGQPYKGKKPFMKCNYYGKGGHVQDDCYFLHGYPGDTKRGSVDDSKKKNFTGGFEKRNYNNQAHFD
ncbi:hypothetical protein P3L10_013971 [Capsicum annuum]